MQAQIRLYRLVDLILIAFMGYILLSSIPDIEDLPGRILLIGFAISCGLMLFCLAIMPKAHFIRLGPVTLVCFMAVFVGWGWLLDPTTITWPFMRTFMTLFSVFLISVGIILLMRLFEEDVKVVLKS